jgi:hypothetical protein
MTDFREGCCFTPDQMVALYRAIGWSAAQKPDALWLALNGSAYVVSAWEGDTLAPTTSPEFLVSGGCAVALDIGQGAAGSATILGLYATRPV